MTREPHETILSYWFGEHAADYTDAEIINTHTALWFDKNARIDAEIRDRFADTLTTAAQSGLEHWAKTPRGRLALIILLDQFPRNIHRDTPAAFVHDHLALSHSLEGQAWRQDENLRPVERLFFYMPMMHAETLAMQNESVRRFQALADAAPDNQRPAFDRSLDAARQHRDIILRFERFPHRNRILQRQSTPAEKAFLEQPNSAF